MRVAVMGAGSWGTAYSQVLADAGHDVALWGRDLDVVTDINRHRHNGRYLPGIELPTGVRAEHDAVSALADRELVVIALPAQTLRANLDTWGSKVSADATVVSLIKGLELGSLKRMSEVIIECTQVAADHVVVLSGPNLAREVAARQPAATVVACRNEDVAKFVQAASMTPYFRPYTNHDVVGVEFGGVVKNVIALATGIAEGMGFGDNSKASIITRGLAEMTRIGVAMGADPRTFFGLAGVGDLVATCMSPLSRNRTFGENLGRGMSVDEVVAITSQTAEGVKSSQAVLELARAHDVDAPVAEHVAAVIDGTLTPAELVRSVMSRAAKSES